MGDLAILKCVNRNVGGDIFIPLAEWQNNMWVEIDDDYRNNKYINNGKVFHFRPKYEKNTILLATIEANKEQFDPENSGHLLYQIVQDAPIKFFPFILEQKFDKSNLPRIIKVEKGSIQNYDRFYLKISENFIVGPYEIKNEGNEYYGYPFLDDDVFLKCYEVNNINGSENYFKDNNGLIYFIPDESTEFERIIISKDDLIKRFLNTLSKSKILTRNESQKIRESIETDSVLTEFIKKAFPNFIKEKSQIINTLKQIFNEVELTENMKNDIFEFLVTIQSISDSIEKYKEESIKAYKEQKEKEITEELKDYKKNLQEEFKNEEQKLNNIKRQISKEEDIKKSLIELNEKKRDELADYVKNGEKWKKAIANTMHNFNADNKYLLPIKKDRTNVVKNLSFFNKLLENHGIDKDNIIRVKQAINKIINNRIFKVDDFNEVKKIEGFFDFIGHKNGRFVLYPDASWLTQRALLTKKGYLQSIDSPIALVELFKYAEKNDLIFQVEIIGANRAPIEGYFGHLLKGLETNKKIIMENDIIKIPDNVLFLLQIDSDQYTAKLSDWLITKLSTISIDFPLENLPSKISVPLKVLRESEKS